MLMLPNVRPHDDGGIGQTIERYLKIDENNSSTPDLNDKEVKTHSLNAFNPITLFHNRARCVDEPSNRYAVRKIISLFAQNTSCKFCNNHRRLSVSLVCEDGIKFVNNNFNAFSGLILGSRNRGFRMFVDNEKLIITWDQSFIDKNIKWIVDWANNIPEEFRYTFNLFWNLDDLREIFLKKMGKGVYLYKHNGQLASKKKSNNIEFTSILNLFNPNGDKFIEALINGEICLDIDTRVNCDAKSQKYHDHGPHFRCSLKTISSLFNKQNENEQLL